MSEQLVCHCNRCRRRIPVPKRCRTKIRWSIDPFRREPYDLCPNCRDDLQRWLGLVPDDSEGEGQGVRP
ncbi:MAG: hypothetical protein U0800_08515 [Isosphaeraceae bacterium]